MTNVEYNMFVVVLRGIVAFAMSLCLSSTPFSAVFRSVQGSASGHCLGDNQGATHSLVAMTLSLYKRIHEHQLHPDF